MLDLIAEIKAGTTNARLLQAEDRRACVVQLTIEGLSVPEIAQFLKCSDRTITRDRRAIQEAASLHPDPALQAFFAGQVVAEAAQAAERIRRVSRDRETPAAIKVEAEHRCFLIKTTTVQSLQSLGVLPTASLRHEAQITHHSVEVPAYHEIRATLERLREVAAASPGNTAALAALDVLHDKTTRAALAAQSNLAQAQLQSGGGGT